MSKLSKEKKNHLILVAIVTGAVAVGLWYAEVQSQQNDLVQIGMQIEQMHTKLSRADALIRQAPQFEEGLAKRSAELATKEANMAPERDAYAWMLSTINAFMAGRPGITMNVSSPDPVSDMKSVPKFYYKAAVYHVKGVGFYHDIGRFCADFENGFPHFSIQNLEIVPAGLLAPNVGGGRTGSLDAEAEKLEFHFDIVTPVKPSDALSASK